MLVELKNGDTYNGRLVNCDSWMNINLKEVRRLARPSCGRACCLFGGVGVRPLTGSHLGPKPNPR
jgi:small nuclear ribonucleoprotein (snRNP)-like protein